jgi:hypothetical protein
MKASLDRISQSDLKTDGCATMGGVCGIVVEVASEPSTPKIIISSVLYHRGILVF